MNIIANGIVLYNNVLLIIIRIYNYKNFVLTFGMKCTSELDSTILKLDEKHETIQFTLVLFA